MTTVCDAFRDRVRSACTPRAGRTRADRGPKPRRPRPAALRRLTDIRRHLCSLRQAITRLLTGPDEEAPHLLVFRASRAITAMNRLSALPSVGLPLVPQWEDLEGWAQWLEGCNVHMKEVKAQISRAHAATPDRHSKAVQKAFKTPQGRGRFYRAARSGWVEATSVRCARDPKTGTLEHDPDAYMPLVKDAVSRPFSTKKHGPAVPSWRPLTTEELLTGLPCWWPQMYSRDVLWDSLMRPCDTAEIVDTLAEAQGHKSPGFDGISVDLLKLTIGVPYSSVLSFLVALVNASMRTGCCPPTLKAGIIVMIPKPGAPSDDVCDMRPITLLPELGKLSARVLARRCTAVLHTKPHILCDAQRAYLMDGSSKQCIATLLNVIEDFQERRRADASLELIVTSYDIRKAFDSVQHFSIRSSCERLNLPERFIALLLAMLDGATSRVRCADGLTDDFPILSSVRQGDPMAALVFIFVMDALHVGLRNNPRERDSWLHATAWPHHQFAGVL